MRDLFGDVPVSWDEVWRWVEAASSFDRSSWRAAYYAEHWNVAEKIKREKLREYDEYIAALAARPLTTRHRT